MENGMDLNELNVERSDNVNNETDTSIMREHLNENSSFGLHDNTTPPPDYEECLIIEYYRTHDLVSCDTQTDPIPCQCRCHSEGDRNRLEHYRNLQGEHSCSTGYTPFSCTLPIQGDSGHFGVCQNIGHQDENVPAPFDILTVLDPRSTINSSDTSPSDEKEMEVKIGVGILIVVIVITGIIYFSISLTRNH